MHITDILQNSIRAKSTLTTISLVESASQNLLCISIADNGEGMPADILAKASDPFFTTRNTRRLGLGLSLLKQKAIQAGGTFELTSQLGIGTNLTATFQLQHIDTPPLGDVACSIAQMASSNPTLDFVYIHQTDKDQFQFDTREVKQTLEGVPISNSSIYAFLKELISSNLEEIRN